MTIYRQGIGQNTMPEMTNWYENKIEEGIRDIVWILRNNGINTIYSCEHAMVIEAENYEPDEILLVYNLLIERGFSNFKIELVYYQEYNGFLNRHLRICLKPDLL